MTSTLMPHVDDDDSDYYASAHMVRGRRSTSTPTSPVGSGVRRVLSQRRLSSDINALGNQLRHVRFSDNELESTQHTLSTHHQTPHEPKQVIHNTSSRRLSIDEVELYFSDFTKFPPSAHDYVVSKLLKRNDILIASALEFVKSSRNLAFFAKSKVYWVELHNGVMVLHAKRDAVDASPEKMFITGCTPRIVSVRECTMEIEHVFQQKKDYQLVQFQNKMDLFLWWWALQLASVNKAGPTKHSALSMFQLIEVSNPVGNVVFPWPSRGASSARRAASTRPSVTHLILVRHGEAENMHFRVPDEEKGLTKRGREQAASTAAHVAEMLKKAGAGEDNVQLVYGGLRRTRETGEEFVNAMPWLKQKNECCLLEDGAPACIEYTHRMDFRTAMHCTAFETLCRPDANESQRMSSDETSHENFKILICHASFVQHCIAVSCKVSKDVVKIGAPIGHCSITQINATKESGQKDDFKVAFTNRVGHLRLTHRTSE